MRPYGFARLFFGGFFGGRTQFAHTLSHLMSKNNVCLSICVYEHFLLVCKRKRSQKKSTRAVPARHPTAAAQTRTRRLFSPCSAHAPANSLSLKQCGLVRSALPPVPSPLSGSSAVCAAACGGLFFDISNLNVCKCIKLCHSEERSDEESLKILGILQDSSLCSE